MRLVQWHHATAGGVVLARAAAVVVIVAAAVGNDGRRRGAIVHAPLKPPAVGGKTVVSRSALPAMQSSNPFCPRLYGWAERPESDCETRLDVRSTKLRSQGRLLACENISVSENVLNSHPQEENAATNPLRLSRDP